MRWDEGQSVKPADGLKAIRWGDEQADILGSLLATRFEVMLKIKKDTIIVREGGAEFTCHILGMNTSIGGYSIIAMGYKHVYRVDF